MFEEAYYPLSNCEIMRLDVDDEHYYYGGPVEGGTKVFYMSLTRCLDIGAPFPEGLRQYLRMTSFEEQQDRLEYTGARGSKLHAALEALMGAQELESKDYPSMYEKDAVVTFIRMMRFLAPGQFHTELIVADPLIRIAGTLDFEGWVDEWKLIALLEPLKYLETDSDNEFQLKEKWLDLPDSSRRVHIIIDWKFTGRNAYSHKVQAAAYKTMFNKSHPGHVSRCFTWRYSPRHKTGFDFQESLMNYQSFNRIYKTTLEYLQGFPEPPTIKRYPDKFRLYDKLKEKK
jgi:hypothetical protein